MTAKQYLLLALAIVGFVPFVALVCGLLVLGAPFALVSYYRDHGLSLDDEEAEVFA